MAHISSLEARPDRANKNPAVARQLNDLRAELSALQLAMNIHLEMNAKDQLRDLEIVVPTRRRKGTGAQNREAQFGRNMFDNQPTVSGS